MERSRNHRGRDMPRPYTYTTCNSISCVINYLCCQFLLTSWIPPFVFFLFGCQTGSIITQTEVPCFVHRLTSFEPRDYRGIFVIQKEPDRSRAFSSNCILSRKLYYVIAVRTFDRHDVTPSYKISFDRGELFFRPCEVDSFQFGAVLEQAALFVERCVCRG